MERDFLGLGSKASPITVKEETSDSSKDSAPMKSSVMQLSFGNKVSAIPQFLSFKAAQEDRSRKLVQDPLVSSGFMSMSTADAFDTSQKSYSGMIQKSSNLDKQGGNHYPMTSYTLQHLDAHQGHRPEEARMFPVSNKPNQTIMVSMSNPLLHSQLGSTGQNVIGTAIHPQPLGGVPVISPLSVVPSIGSVIGTTDLRNISKPNGAPAQLTIFYNGSVCVYDDVSPEKAQAIMLLAGNGSSATQNKPLPSSIPTAIPAAQIPTSIHRPSIGDGYVRNNSHTTSPCSGLSSPISVTSHVVSQSAVGRSCSNDLAKVKPAGALASSNPQTEPSKAIGSVGAPATSLIPAVAAVPQARKASLARFLEKRKERVMTTSPYNVSKKSPDSSSTAEEISFSINSSGSCLLPAVN